MGRAYEFRKERKFKRWSKMSKSFTKIGREIAISVKEGGDNPETNAKLRMAIQNAKSVNMPKETVERAIQKAASKDQEAYKELVYEGYGPHKIAIVIETATNNPTRTIANIRSYFTKCNGTIGVSGSLDFLFERKCHFKIHSEGINLEEFEFEMIDFGADEIFEDENEIIIYGSFSDFGNIQKALEDRKIEVLSAEFERLPTTTKELSEEYQEEVHKLLSKLEDDDDVINVYHNMA